MEEKKQALRWIAKQNTKYCRTVREKAKYLVSITLPAELPHIAIWWEVLKLSKGLK